MDLLLPRVQAPPGPEVVCLCLQPSVGGQNKGDVSAGPRTHSHGPLPSCEAPRYHLGPTLPAPGVRRWAWVPSHLCGAERQCLASPLHPCLCPGDRRGEHLGLLLVGCHAEEPRWVSHLSKGVTSEWTLVALSIPGEDEGGWTCTKSGIQAGEARMEPE